MFSYEVIKSFNELEMSVYNYIMENKEQIRYMPIRELADAAHVSTSTVMRFCKKVGCEGFAEFRVKFKMYLNEEKAKSPKEDIEEIKNYFQNVETPAFEESVNRIAEMIRNARQVIFIGLGTSGILGKYGARYFSNLNKYSQHIEDPYYPIAADMPNTVVIALSVSGETLEVIKLAGRFKEHACRLISITNKGSSTLAKMSDENLSYYVSERVVQNEYNITTQIPVIFLIETIGRRL